MKQFRIDLLPTRSTKQGDYVELTSNLRFRIYLDTDDQDFVWQMESAKRMLLRVIATLSEQEFDLEL